MAVFRAVGMIRRVLDQLWNGGDLTELQIIDLLRDALKELGYIWKPPPEEPDPSPGSVSILSR